ncbi:hypothetical protein EIP91_000964 [Steccherinum ochraceum]|uniref:SprT-like domain-containing protein n=1 Tax=Steccherinum ochraceum TaxID=92696 RepID=A0A4R0RIW6_9APHY|nr:hypothetical protein EIP91_000964 [Steccherinum ochraceum]
MPLKDRLDVDSDDEIARLIAGIPGSFTDKQSGNAKKQEVIEISSDEDDAVENVLRHVFLYCTQTPKTSAGSSAGNSFVARGTRLPTSSQIVDLTLDSDSDEPSAAPSKLRAVPENDVWEEDDGAILTFNEPKSARKPLSTPTAKRTKKAPRPRQILPSASLPSIPDEYPGIADISDSDDDEIVPRTPSKTRKPKSSTSTTSTPRSSSKKSVAAAEQARRETYARQFFNDLNEKVFGNGLPRETRLNWNVRLLTTAGRAKWRRNNDGTEMVEIELATKILDEDFRIRNTLAHEMCHLACWIIDKNPQENHGRLFKSWGARVMRRMPNIEVNTRHNYDINYPYEWKCETCSKIYGRFSRSIRPEECLCGACKTGKLIPLFTTRAISRTGSKASTTSSQSTKSSSSGGLALVDTDRDSRPQMHATTSTSKDGDDGRESDDEDLRRLVRSLGEVELTE